MAFGKKKLLRVEFFDQKTDQVIGFDELPLKEIPQDFELETWVEIDGDRWKVVQVEPSRPKKALRSGTLVVHVELVERRTPIEEPAPVVEVKEAPVFQRPSRADQMPRMSGKREDLKLLEIGTWEWRDREFTIAANRSTVRDVFAKISELEMLNSTVRDGKTFYTRQYDRYDLFAPLRGSKVLLEGIVTDYFPEARAIDGLTFMGSEQVADSTFVFRVESGVVFYGQEFDEVVRYLAVHRPDQMHPESLRADSAKLATFMRKKGLILVDWTKRMIVEAEPDSILDYFLSGFTDEAVASAREFFAQNPMVEPAKEAEVKPSIQLEKAPETKVETISPEAPATVSVQVPEPPASVQPPISIEMPALELTKVNEPVEESPLEEVVKPSALEQNKVVESPVDKDVASPAIELTTMIEPVIELSKEDPEIVRQEPQSMEPEADANNAPSPVLDFLLEQRDEADAPKISEAIEAANDIVEPTAELVQEPKSEEQPPLESDDEDAVETESPADEED